MKALKYAAAAAVLVVAMQGCFGNKSTESGKENRNITSSSAADASSSESTAVPVPQSGSPSSVGVTSAAVRAVALSLPVTELPENNTTVASVEVAYSDGRKKPFSSGIAWIIGDPDIIEVKGTKLIARKEGSTTVRAKVGGKLSPQKTVTVYKLIHGHRLPPEPDPEINNATLLGVDINHNDVRDDVERWIYETYKDKHPIYIDIAMQAGRAYKQVLETPEKALDIHEVIVNAPLYCATYYQYYAQYFGDKKLVNERIDAPVKSKYFNTKDRSNIYWEYDKLLSGRSYPLPKMQDEKSFCDFNTTKYDK